MKKCPKCGYKVVMKELDDCPLCAVCSNCNKEVHSCICKEGE